MFNIEYTIQSGNCGISFVLKNKLKGKGINLKLLISRFVDLGEFMCIYIKKEMFHSVKLSDSFCADILMLSKRKKVYFSADGDVIFINEEILFIFFKTSNISLERFMVK